MGRYVEGDFKYKFAFGEQRSSLGIILDNINNELPEDIEVNRYFCPNGNGEICKLYIHDIKNFEGYINDVFLEDFEPKTNKNWEGWCSMKQRSRQGWHDQNMIRLLLEKIKEDSLTSLTLDIEY